MNAAFKYLFSCECNEAEHFQLMCSPKLMTPAVVELDF